MNISQALKKARQDSLYNQSEFAKLVGISQTYMSQIENGKKEPSIEVILKIEKVTQKPLAIILWGGITEADVQKNKRGVYRELKPVVDNLIAQFF